ncbi:MAG: 23S rRNA (guanosine(2251)-2'-O)-methyltransferase RlmB, partial [Epsilonproteobacteria bacterium]|nr:23S rRNA (guanosine(2251)-2'-O)-methyltransferase RlmB [Campylobacterota bacterium]
MNSLKFFDRVLTIYGRNAVLEALEDDSLSIYKLHLSKSNKPSPQLNKMVKIAQKRDIEIAYHDK